MGNFEPSKAEFIGSRNISSTTKSFISSADDRSLTATLYNPASDSGLLSRAGRVILNMGSLSSYGGNFEENEADVYKYNEAASKLSSQGVKVTKFSRPEDMRRIHIKSYTANFNGRREALISTGNLTDSSLKPLPINRRVRIREGNRVQHNIGLRIKDSSLVNQIDQVQRDALQNKTPRSTKNVLIGGKATSSVSNKLNKVNKGDKVTVSAPYLDDPGVVNALLNAEVRGADVTVISSWRGKVRKDEKPDSGGGRSTLSVLDTLASNGVDVLTPTKNDPLLIHTKAVSIVSKAGRSTVYVGSHNLTEAATRGDSVDLLVNIDDKGLASNVADELIAFSSEAGLRRHKIVKKNKRSGVETRMSAVGMQDLYRVPIDFKTATRQPIGETLANKAEEMPNYPTKMSEAFFASFMGRPLPKISIYSDLWVSRTGDSDIPESLKRMDREMGSPGLGNSINYFLGKTVYKEDQGAIGSAVVSAGRFMDWALGFDSFKEREADRKNKDIGTIHKMFGMQGSKGDSEGGPFESISSKMYDVLSGAAITMSTYIAVDLPFKYIKAKAVDDFFDLSLKPQKFTEASKHGDLAKRWSRYLVFGGPTSDLMNEFEAKHGFEEMQVKMKTEFEKVNLREAHPDRVVNTGTGSGAQKNRYGYSKHRNSLATYAAGLNQINLTRIFRQFDSARFNSILKPMFENINPYVTGDANSPYGLFQKSIDDLGDAAGAMPRIETETDKAGNTVQVFKNIGVDQLRKTAVAYDNISSLLPANMLYWTKSTRDLLNLPEFDPKENLTIRDLVSFENAVKWTESFYDKVVKAVRNPIASLKELGSAWRSEIRLTIQEQNLTKNVVKLHDLSHLPTKLAGSGTEDVLEKLHKIKAETFYTRTHDINTLIASEEFRSYASDVKSQNKRLQSDLFSRKSSDDFSSNPFKKDGTDARKRVDKVKKGLLLLGVVLAADTIADKVLFQPLGASLSTQVAAAGDLSTKDGDVARFLYTGTLSREQAIAAQVAGALAGGFALPKFKDISADPKSIRTLMTDADMYGKQLDSLIDTHKYANGSAATAAVLDAEELAAKRIGKYAQAKANLTEVSTGRSRMRFNSGAALMGAFVAGIAVKSAAAGVAWALNKIGNRKWEKMNLSDSSGVMAARFEKIAVDTLKTAKTHDDYVDAAMAHNFAKQMLVDKAGSPNRIYTIATQITTPFFQLPLVVKVDQLKGKASFGIGLQLMQSTGVGFTPVFPVAIRLKNKPQIKMMDHNHHDWWSEWVLRENTKKDASGPVGKAVMFADAAWQKVTSVLSGVAAIANMFVYESDSAYEQGMDFIAASTGLMLTAQAVKDADPRGMLVNKYGSNHRVVKELDDLLSYTRIPTKVALGGFEVANKSARFLYSIPLKIGEGTALGAQMAWRESKSWYQAESGAANKIPELLPKNHTRVRRVLPYALAISYAGMLLDPGSGYVDPNGAFGEDNRYAQAQAKFVAGGVIGFVLDKSGVFASAEDLAEDFREGMKAKGATKADYLSATQSWMPKLDKNDVKSAADLSEIAEGMMRSKPARQSSGKRFHMSKYLLGEMAAPALWTQGVDSTAYLKSGSVAAKSARFTNKLPGASIKSVGARIAVGALAVYSVKMAASVLSNLMSDQQLAATYSVPFLGPALRLLSGVEVDNDKLTGRGTVGRTGATGNKKGNIAQRLFNDLTFGVLKVGESTGIYSDEPDPFLNMIGPVGVTFKEDKVNHYTQYSTAFSDLSYTAYDVSFGNNKDALMYDLYARMEAGKAKTFNQAWAQVRGGTARKSAATHKGTTKSEMEALGKSSSLSRAASIRHAKIEHQSWQTAQEHNMDFTRLSFKYGRRKSSVIPGDQEKGYSYNPFNVLQIASLGKETKRGKAYGSSSKVDIAQDDEDKMMQWIASSDWKRSTVVKAYGLSAPSYRTQWDAEVEGIPGAALLSTVIVGAHLLSTLLGVGPLIGILSAKAVKDEMDGLVKGSYLNQVNGRSAVNVHQYKFETGVMPSGQTAIFQVDTASRSTSVLKLPMYLEDINGRAGSKYTASQMADFVSTKYKKLHRGLDLTIRRDYASKVDTLLKVAREGSDSAYEKAAKDFKKSALDSIDRTITNKYKATVGSTPVSLFQVMTGVSDANLNEALDTFVLEGRELMNSSFDEVLEELDGMRSSGFSGVDGQLGKMRLNSKLTNSKAFKQFYNRLERPIHGSFDDQAVRVGDNQKWNKAVLGKSLGEDAEKYAQRAKQEKVSSRKSSPMEGGIPSRPVDIGAAPWSEGFIKGGMKGLKGASSVTAAWAFEGVSIYEVGEAAIILSGGKRESASLRESAGKQLVSSAFYWMTSAAIAAGLVAAGIGGLPALVIGIAGSFGLEFIKKQLKPIDRLGNSLIKSLGSLFARPVDATADQLDKVGLGSGARWLGNLIATPASAVLSFLTSPIRKVLKSVVAPVLQDQHFKMGSDNAFWQLAKTMFLPNSVFANFNHEEGRQTWYGKEPWIYGNSSIAVKQRQLEKITAAITNDGSFDKDRVHPFLSGGVSNGYEQLIYQKYFSSAAGGRIFDPFSPGATYSMSNSMRLALQRRQSAVDSRVTMAAVSRAPDTDDLTVVSVIRAVDRTLAASQYLDFSTNVVSTLGKNITSVTKSVAWAVDQFTNYVGKFNAKLSSLTPGFLRNLDLKAKAVVRFVGRRFKAIALKHTGRRSGFLNPALNFIQSSLQKVGASPAQIVAKFKGFSPRFAQTVGGTYLNLGWAVEQLWGSLPGLIDRSISQIQKEIEVDKRVLKKINKITGISQKLRAVASIPTNFVKATMDAIAAVTGKSKGTKQLSIAAGDNLPGDIPLISHTDYYGEKLGKFIGGYLNSLDTKPKRLDSKLVNFLSTSIPRQLTEIKVGLHGAGYALEHLGNRAKSLLHGSTNKLLSKLSPGVAAYSALATLDILSSIHSDQRQAALNPNSRFREFEAAYTESAVGVSGSAIGIFMSGATKNPLLAVTSALLGGIFLGDAVGAYTSREAYEKRYEKKTIGTKIADFLKRSAAMSVISTLARLPEYYKLAQAGNLSGVVKRVLSNIGMSFATSGLGPSTQFSLLSYGQDAINAVSANRSKLKSVAKNFKSVVSETPDYLNLIFKNKVSQEVSGAAQSSYRAMVDNTIKSNGVTLTDAKSVEVQWKGSRWMPDGKFTGKSIELSTSTQSILGRAKLGRYVPRKMLDEAVFTSLHEIAHALEINNGMSRMGGIDFTRLAGKLDVDTQELTDLVDSIAKEATSTVAFEIQDLNQKNYLSIYKDEYSATARAFESMESQGLGDVKRLYKSKYNQFYKRKEAISDLYDKRFAHAGDYDNADEYLTRHRPGSKPRSVNRSVKPRVGSVKRSVSGEIPSPRAKVVATKTLPKGRTASSFGMLNDLFAVGDVAYGLYANKKLSDASVKYSGKVSNPKDLREASNAIAKARKTQMSAVVGTVATITSSFVSSNWLLSLGVGVASGIAVEMGLLGSSKKQAGKDRASLESGDAITGGFSSSSYVRLQKSLTAEKEFARAVFKRPSEIASKSVDVVKDTTKFVSTLASETTRAVGKKSVEVLDVIAKGRISKTAIRLSTALDNSTKLKSLVKSTTRLVDSIKGKGSLTRTLAKSFSNKFSAVSTRLGDNLASATTKVSPRFGKHVLKVGYKEALIDTAGIAFDVTSFTSGAFKAIRLDNTATRAEVQDAYAQMGSARGGLVGSVFGKAAFGGLGDIAGSIVGSITGVNESKELADLRYETKDYGFTSIADDMLQPMFRELTVAAALGKAAGKYAGSLSKSIIGRKAAGVALTKSDKLIRSGVAAYKTSSRVLTKEAAERTTRVLGKEATEQSVKTLGKLAVLAKGASKFARVLGRVIDPVISIGLLGSAIAKGETAETAAETESAIRRSTTSYGSLGGFAIGSALGPIGAAVGSIAGDTATDQYAKSLSKRAIEKGVSAKRIVRGQAVGGAVGVVGAALAAVGAAALVVGGVLAAPVALAGAAVVGGVSLLAGAIGGGEVALKTGKSKGGLTRGNREEVDDQVRKINHAKNYRKRNQSEDNKDARRFRLFLAAENRERPKEDNSPEKDSYWDRFMKPFEDTAKSVISAANKAARLAERGIGAAKRALAGAAWAVGQAFNPSNSGPVGALDGSQVGRVMATAESWIGRHFNQGVSAQCAYFVRNTFKEAGVELGIRPGGGPGMAEDLFHESVGQVGYTNDPNSIPKGALVGFYQTYGDWGPNVITHVGISGGNNRLIDRSTSSNPVYDRTISGAFGDNTNADGNFIYVIPRGLAAEPNSTTLANPTNTKGLTTSAVASAAVPRTRAGSGPAVAPTRSSGGAGFRPQVETENHARLTLSFAGPLVFPVQGRSRGEFDVSPGQSFWAHRNRASGPGTHFGQDFAVATGSRLLSAVDGRITKINAPTSSAYADITIETTDLNGRRVEIKYGHISGVDVQVGQNVAAGQLVGRSGGDPGDLGYGSGSGSHLDVKVLVDDVYVDPEAMFRGSVSQGAATDGGAATFSPGSDSSGVGSIAPVVRPDVGIIDVANQRRRSGGYSAERIAASTSASDADKSRLASSIELVRSAVPILNLGEAIRGIADRAATYTNEQIETITDVVIETRARAGRAIREARQNVTSAVSGISLNTNNPTAESRHSTQNADPSRPAARTSSLTVQVSVAVGADNSPKIKIELSDESTFRQNWDTTTGLPRLSDYQNLDGAFI